MILAIETSTTACSVALGSGVALRSRVDCTPRAHHALLLPMIDSLLGEAGIALVDLDAIAFGQGPGSFTGLRIAASAAQGLAFGAALPVIPVSSLEALAMTALAAMPEAAEVLVAVDAHMGDVYWSRFTVSAGVSQGVDENRLDNVDQFGAMLSPLPAGMLLAGDAWRVYKDRLDRGAAVYLDCVYPDAAKVISLAERVDRSNWLQPQQVEPLYVRPASVWKKIDQQ